MPLYLLPHHALSRAMLALTRIRTAWFKNHFIQIFSQIFAINWDEPVHNRPEDFEHFNAFFTRALKPEVRPLDTDPASIISPADGRISQIGAIRTDTMVQAKGFDFTTNALLGGNKQLSDEFEDGRFTTIYLSPRDYHRLHMPISGRLLETIYIPGRLFSVAPHTARTIPALFARNERLVAIFDTEHGKMALVLVGAIFVAAIETVWAGLVTPPHGSDIIRTDYRHQNIHLHRGEEMGRFNMGSTIIVLFQNDRIDWLDSLEADKAIKMGEKIAMPIK